MYCTALHCRRRRGGGRSIADRGRERRAWTKPPYPYTQTGWATYTMLCYTVSSFHSSFCTFSAIVYSFSFYSFTHRLNDRCAILIEFVHNSLPTHSHLHPLPSPPPHVGAYEMASGSSREETTRGGWDKPRDCWEGQGKTHRCYHQSRWLLWMRSA